MLACQGLCELDISQGLKGVRGLLSSGEFSDESNEMTKRTLVASILGVTTVVVISFLAWYQSHYSMDVADSFQVGENTATNRVLIATQGSEFKDAVVDGVVKSMSNQSVYLKIIDVAGLNTVDASQWDAVVVLHTWEKWEPPSAVETFMARWHSKDNFVVLATSGSGDEKIEGVDAIATASRMAEVPERVVALVRRIDRLLIDKTS